MRVYVYVYLRMYIFVHKIRTFMYVFTCYIYMCAYMCICICTGGWVLDVNIGKIITRKNQLVIATSTIAQFSKDQLYRHFKQ